MFAELSARMGSTLPLRRDTRSFLEAARRRSTAPARLSDIPVPSQPRIQRRRQATRLGSHDRALSCVIASGRRSEIRSFCTEEFFCRRRQSDAHCWRLVTSPGGSSELNLSKPLAEPDARPIRILCSASCRRASLAAGPPAAPLSFECDYWALRRLRHWKGPTSQP